MKRSHPQPLTGIESGLVTLNGRPLPEYVQLVEERLVTGDRVRIIDLMMPAVGYVVHEAAPLHAPYTDGSHPPNPETHF